MNAEISQNSWFGGHTDTELLVEADHASRTLRHLYALAVRVKRRQFATLTTLERAMLLQLRLLADLHEEATGEALRYEIGRYGPYQCGFAWTQAMKDPEFLRRTEAFSARYDRIRGEEEAMLEKEPERGLTWSRTLGTASIDKGTESGLLISERKESA
jgi:hypothetical protein